MAARRAQRVPAPSQQPGPPHTCVGLGDARAGSQSRSRLCWLDLQCLGCWILHLRLGLGGQGKKGDSEEGDPHPSGHAQRRSWGHPHLEHHDFAIVCLQVEGPGGGDEALGRADDVVAEGGDQIQHGKGRRLQLQALQRSGNITSALSPRHPPRQDTSHPEVTAGLSRVLSSGLHLLLPGMQCDVPGSNPVPGGSPSEGCDPWGDHPALGSSPSPRTVPSGWDHPHVAETMGAEQPRCRGRSSPGSLSVPWILGRLGSLLFLKHPCWNPLGCSLPLAPNIFRQPLARSNQQTGNK